MNYCFEEIAKLYAILEAESAGHGIDHHEGHRLALRIAEIYPGVAKTMAMIAERMMAPFALCAA